MQSLEEAIYKIFSKHLDKPWEKIVESFETVLKNNIVGRCIERTIYSVVATRVIIRYDHFEKRTRFLKSEDGSYHLIDLLPSALYVDPSTKKLKMVGIGPFSMHSQDAIPLGPSKDEPAFSTINDTLIKLDARTYLCKCKNGFWHEVEYKQDINQDQFEQGFLGHIEHKNKTCSVGYKTRRLNYRALKTFGLLNN